MKVRDIKWQVPMKSLLAYHLLMLNVLLSIRRYILQTVLKFFYKNSISSINFKMKWNLHISTAIFMTIFFKKTMEWDWIINVTLWTTFSTLHEVASVLFYCTEKFMKILLQKFSPENCEEIYGVHSCIYMI